MTDSKDDDPIFRLKNFASVRSPLIGLSLKEAEKSVKAMKNKSPPISEDTAKINSIFDQMYRATPLPGVILQSSNYGSNFWDQGYNTVPKLQHGSYSYENSLFPSSSQNHHEHFASRNQHQPYPMECYQQRDQYAPSTIEPPRGNSNLLDYSSHYQLPCSSDFLPPPHVPTATQPYGATSRIEPLEQLGHFQNPLLNSSQLKDICAVDSLAVPAVNAVVDPSTLCTTIGLHDDGIINDSTECSEPCNADDNYPEEDADEASDTSTVNVNVSVNASASSTVGTPTESSNRPRGRRKFVADSLFSLSSNLSKNSAQSLDRASQSNESIEMKKFTVPSSSKSEGARLDATAGSNISEGGSDSKRKEKKGALTGTSIKSINPQCVIPA